MSEELTLTTPASVTTYRVQRLVLDWPGQRIKIVLSDQASRETLHGYRGAEAVLLMTALNKADLSVKSLHKRILERLDLDGKLPDGTVTGSPD